MNTKIIGQLTKFGWVEDINGNSNDTGGVIQIDHDDLLNKGVTRHVDIDTHISSSAAHGVSSPILGSTDAQAMSNKAISLSTIETSTFAANSNFMGSNNQVLTRPNGPDLLLGASSVQSVTNKNISNSSILNTTIEGNNTIKNASGGTITLPGGIGGALLLDTASSQTISNKAFSSNNTYLHSIDNTIGPTTYLCKQDTAGTQTELVQVQNIQSTMLGDGGSLVKNLDSPTFTALTVNSITQTQDLYGNYIKLDSSTSDPTQIDFQRSSVTKMSIANDTTGNYVGGSESLFLYGGTSYLGLDKNGIISRNGNNTYNTVLCTDGGTIINKRTDFVDTSNSQTLSNKNFVDASTFIIDSVDATKRLKYDVGGTTNTTTTITVNPSASRTYTVQDIGANSNFCMTDGVYYNSTNNQGVAPSLGYKVKIWRGTSTTTSGIATFNVTTDGLASPGAAIFTSLSACCIQATATNNTASAIQVPLCAIKAITSTQVTVNVVNGSTAVLESNTLTFVPNGTVVNLLVIGV